MAWDASATELTDLVADPGEQADLANDRPEVAARLEKHVREWWTQLDATRPGVGSVPHSKR